ncbi:quinon protein alcohol dehydrogenase-like superfamily [Rhizoctonia solani]|nr:quinon protein alcohol dehydrogenase-like superfamily [Rhizoctonia solani]
MPALKKFRKLKLALKFWSSPTQVQNAAPPSETALQDNGRESPQTLPSRDDIDLDNWPHLHRLQIKLRDESGWVRPETRPLWHVIWRFSKCITIFEVHLRNNQEYDILRDEFEALFRELRRHCRHKTPELTTAIKGLCLSIELELSRMKEQYNVTEWRSHPGIEIDAKNVASDYRQIQIRFQVITLNTSVWQDRNISSKNSLLESLSFVQYARYTSKGTGEIERGPCTKGTRVAVLQWIHTWVDSPSSGLVYWINGMAGTGKTTIAYSLCKGLDDRRKLAASYFCSRSLPGCGNARTIIPTIAYQLANFSGPFRCALLATLRDSNSDPINHSPDLQFHHLICQPLLEVKRTLPESIVIVIDALDECEDREGVSRLLEVLLAGALDLPLKFVISSRPEPNIRNVMKKQCKQTRSRVTLHELNPRGVKEDLQSYFLHSLELYSGVGRWVKEEKRSALVEQAGSLFLYAKGISQYIVHGELTGNAFKNRLANILDSDLADPKHIKFGSVDDMYASILHTALDDPALGEAKRDDMQQVLYLAACSQEAMTVEALSELLKIKIDRVWDALQPLWSVLHIAEDNGTVTVLHPSFHQFLLNPLWEGRFFINPTVYRQTMIHRCFRMFRELQPQFNICGLKSSYLPDSAVSGLKEIVENTISADIFYSARHWVEYLLSAHEAIYSKLIVDLRKFLSTQLLLWMEIMNLKGHTQEIPEVIQQVKDWAQSVPNFPDDLRELINDAWQFTTTFAHGAVSNSTPHIYTSMVAFWPRSSPIGKCYARLVQGIRFQGTAMHRPQVTLLTTRSFETSTISPVYSPDGIHVAVAVGDNLLLLGNLGDEHLSTFQGHSNTILSIQFSPDGMRIVSGSRDKTIRIWSTQDKSLVCEPLEGHVAPVNTVTFSPDGALITSGSADKTIRTWDSRTGRHLSQFNMDYGPIVAIKYTPDGRFIVVCGSNNVVVQDASGGQALKTLHSNRPDIKLTSVDISRNGMRIASCSERHGIHIWDTYTGELIVGPLGMGGVRSLTFTSISFSPGGSWLVSGSGDGSLRLWDALRGDLVLHPPKVHTGSITSARFSPTGDSIVSGSTDTTLQLWDVRALQVTSNLLPAHINSVTSVGYSPDGTRIVSGSADGTLCTWDAESGMPVLGPLRKNRNDAMLISYSPDGTRILYDSPGGLALLNAQTGYISAGPIQLRILQSVQSAVLFADSARIIVASVNNIVKVLAVDTGETLVEVCPPVTNQSNWVHVTSALISPDGDRIAVGSMHLGPSIFDARNGKLLCCPLDGHNNNSRSLAFSPDSQRIISGEFSSILVRDAQTGETTLGPLKGHTGWVHSVEYSPDGAQIVSGARDNSVRVWDAQTGWLILGPFRWHTAPVRSVRFSPDGIRVVSGSEDKTIRVTNIEKEFEYPPAFLAPGSGEWELNTDGWVIDGQGRLLVWVPPELRASLMWPRTELLISRKGWLRLDFSDARLGESWNEVYNPEVSD